MACVLRLSGADRGAGPEAEAFTHRPEPPLQARRGRRTGTASGSAGTEPARRRGSSTASSRPGTTAPARTGGAYRITNRVRAHPRLLWIADPADELPPFPSRPLALDAQRAHQRVLEDQARPRTRRRPRAVPGDRGLDRLRAVFLPARTLGLEDDPPGAVERAVGLIEETGRRHGVEHPIQMTVATSDGTQIWAFTPARGSRARSSRRMSALCVTSTPTTPCSTRSRRVEARRLGAARRPCRRLERGSRVDLGVIREGQDELHPFTPRPPS